MNHSLRDNIKLLFLICSLLFSSYQAKAEHGSHRAAPVVTGVFVPDARSEYKTGEVITFFVEFSEIVVTNPNGVTPYLPVKIGSKQLMLPMYAGIGLPLMGFQYTIQPGDQDLDGIEIGTALTISSGTIQNNAGDVAVMTLNNVADTRGVLINSSYPTVDLSGPSASVVNGSFQVLVVFSDFVSGLTASDFTLVNATITEPQTTDSVNYFIDVTPITDGPLSILLPANAAVNKGPNGNQVSNQINLTADLTPPTITRIDIPAPGKYGTTSSLDFTVHFSEPVTVRTNNGTPTLALTIGGKAVVADFTSWMGYDVLTFSYNIADGDMDMDGIALGANLLLNGATIRDAGRNNANLALPAGIDPSGIVVNTIRPTAVLSCTADSLVNNPFTVTLVFSEPVTGVTESSFQTTNLYFDGISTTDNIHYTLAVGANTNGPVKISLLQDGGLNPYSSGNTASNEITRMADFTSPKITRLLLPANATYNMSDVMNFTVEYNEVVYVKTTGGIPNIPITVGTKGVKALYLSGSGTNALVYSYAVKEGELDLDGVTLGRDIMWGGGRVQDLAGNDALTRLPANNTTSLIVNAIRPTVVLSTTAAAILRDPFTVKAVFSGVVNGLTAAGFTAVNATVSNLQSVDNITYTVTITPLAEGGVSVSLPKDAAVSTALNGNAASNQLNFTADFTPPVITQIDLPAKGNYHTGDKLTFVVHFSEDVVINTTNGNYNLPIHINTWWAPAFYGGVFTANTMTFTYIILNGDKANGIVFGPKFGKNGNETIRDIYGNNANINIPANIDGSGIFVNAVQPGVVLSTAAASTVNQPFTVTAVFSEPVTGLAAADFIVNNATVSDLQIADTVTFTLLVSPTSDGAVSISLPADIAINAGGVGNTASNAIAVNADMTAPVVTQVGVPADGYYNASGTLSFTVAYGEPVVVNTTNGTPALPVNIGGTVVQAQYTGGSGTSQLTFDYAIQPGDADMDGIAVGTTLLLNSGTMKDTAGNNAGLTLNNMAVTTGIFVNTIHPTVTLSTNAPAVLNNPFIITAVFSERVTGLTLAGLNLVNANGDVPQTTDSITYTIEITPMTNGPVSVSIAADAAVNVGQNGNTASNQMNVTADFRQPKITQVDKPADGYYNATQTLSFTVHFDETVMVDTSRGIPLMAVNMDVATVPVEYVSGSGTNALLFRYAIQEGDMDVDGISISPALSLGAGATIRDAAGNDVNLIFPAVVDGSGIFVNTAHPDVVLSTTAGATVTAPFVVTATFTEAVTGLAEADFTVTNATVSNLQTTNRITYTFSVTPTADGAVNVLLPADMAVNIGNNGNTASNTMSVTADITPPVITRVDVPADGYYNADSTLTFALRYSEPVVVNTMLGKPSVDINIGGTTVAAVYISGTGTSVLTFRYAVRNGDMDMDGILLNNGMVMNGGTIKDVAGNDALLTLNNIAPTSGIFVNTTHPTVTLSTTVATTVNAPFTVTAVFSEAVTGLTVADFALTNASAATLQTNDKISYALFITPTADGAVGILLPANAAVNIGNNANTASNTLTINADLTAPVIAAGQAFNVNEHSPVGTIAGTLTAIETVGILQHWTITTDGSGGAFAIDAATGRITVKDNTILDSKVNTTVTLTVTVSDGLNTSAPETVSINVVQISFPPTDIKLDNNTINERSAAGTLVGTLSAVSPDPAATFTYRLITGTGSTDNSQFVISGNQLQTAAVLSYGVMSIRVQATGNNGLSVEKVLTITVNQVNQAPVMDVISDQQVCNVSDVQTLQLTGASPVEAGQTLTYTIAADQPYFNTLTVSSTGLMAYRIKSGVSGLVNVTVTLKDNGGIANGGTDSLQRTFKITVSALPVVTINSDKGNTITKGTVIQLTASGGATYSWANADGIISGQQDAVLKVKQTATTIYQVTATNVNGCSNTATITITVAEGVKVDAGNILTPNGDGKNDRWIVNNLALYPDNEVTIYDRAGRVVYHRRNYSNDWDGTVNGKPLAEGTYYYVLVIKDNNTVVKGFITILRDK